RNGIVDLAEWEHDILHGGNCQPFTGAPMRSGELAAALRNKLERRGFVLRKPFGLKGVRMAPDAPVVVRAVEVEYQPVSRVKTDVLPLKIRANPRANCREEGIKPPHFMHEGVHVMFMSRGEVLTPLRILPKGHGREHGEPGDRDDRTQNVEKFFAGHAQIK